MAEQLRTIEVAMKRAMLVMSLRNKIPNIETGENCKAQMAIVAREKTEIS